MAANIIQHLQQYPGRDITLHLSNGDVVEGSYIEANVDIIRIKLDDGRVDFIDPADLVHFKLRKVG